MGDSYRPGGGRNTGRSADSYARRHNYDDSRRYPPPPPAQPPPPLPRGPPPSMYNFTGGDSYRPGAQNSNQGSRDRHDDRRDEFTFRSGEGMRFPNGYDRIPPGNRDRPYSQRRRPYRDFRPQFSRPHTSDRPILRTQREATPEQLAGMGDGAAQFAALEDLSESEAEMDLETDDEASSPGSGEVEKKKARAEPEVEAVDDSVPKWSNPDPYTALPPPDESRGKKKDVVQLIRKAKIAKTKEQKANPVAANVDFISFNFDESAASVESDNESQSDQHVESVPPQASSQIVTGSMNQIPSPKGVDVWPPPDVASAIDHGKKRLMPEEDQANTIPHAPKKRKRTVAGDGRVLSEWQPRNNTKSVPWCTIDHSQTDNMGHWLHKEICDFYEFVKPHPFEDAIRNDLISRIQMVLRNNGAVGGHVYAFGSFAAGLYLPTADMDLVLITDRFRSGSRRRLTPGHMHQVLAILKRADIVQPNSSEVIAGARVPIIKFVDRTTGLKVDLSFDNTTGIVANETFQTWKMDYPAMPIVVSLIKQYLLMRGLNEVFTGGLGGFSVICLVTSLIQLLPSVQSGAMQPEENLGELLMDFFELYGKKFNINTTMISLNPPGYSPKGPYALDGKAQKGDRLSIVDPNTHWNDISSGSKNVKRIFECFSDAYDALQKRMTELSTASPEERKGSSILGSVFAGDYSSFESQREHLRRIHEQR